MTLRIMIHMGFLISEFIKNIILFITALNIEKHLFLKVKKEIKEKLAYFSAPLFCHDTRNRLFWDNHFLIIKSFKKIILKRIFSLICPEK